MNCYVFDVHINCCFTYENSEHNLVEFGPLNMIDPHILSRIARTLQGISLQDVRKNWWTEFSTWRDDNGNMEIMIREDTKDMLQGLTEQGA